MAECRECGVSIVWAETEHGDKVALDAAGSSLRGPNRYIYIDHTHRPRPMVRRIAESSEAYGYRAHRDACGRR